jgi:hypothetical protein
MVARAFRGRAVALGVLPFALGCSQEPRQGTVSTAVERAPAVSATPSWTVSPNSPSAYYGDAAASAGDVNGDGYGDIVVGAWGYDGPGGSSGRAFLYYGSANGLDTTAAWTRGGDQDAEHLGDAVASAGDVNGDGYADVLVGAPNYSNGEFKEGRAMVFLGSASGPSQTPAWEVESNVARALFGMTLAAAGDVNDDGYADIVVGGTPGGVFLGSSSGLSLTPSFVTREIAASAGDVNGDGYSDIITGYSDLATGDGDCVLYLGSASGVTPTPAWSWVPGNGHFVNCGNGGDVDGDGYTEIVVARWGQEGTTDLSPVLVFHGGPSGPPSPSSPSKTFELTDLGGFALGNGDVNGDGYSDLFIGAPYDNDGSAFVHLGSAVGLETAAAWTAAGAQFHAAFGFVATSAGDVNGDGFADLLVTAPQVGPNSTEGRAFVYHGDACPDDCPDEAGGAGGEAGQDGAGRGGAGQGGASGNASAARGGSSAGRGGTGSGGRSGSGGTTATGGTSPAAAGEGGESGDDSRGDAGEASGGSAGRAGGSGGRAGGSGGRAGGSGGRAGGAAGSGAPPTGGGEETGGCGCRVGARSRSADALALVAVLGLIVARRRRR